MNGAKSVFTVAFPEFWLYFLGLIFILVTLFLPQGVMGLLALEEAVVSGQAELLPDPGSRPWPWWPPAGQAAAAAPSGGASHGRRVEVGNLDLSHGVVLYLEDISVSFDGFRALNKLSLAIDAGELRCVIGPNGAGKTTMMDVITGKTRPDAGRAWFGQTIDLTAMTEAQIAHAGIGRKFQKPTIFEPTRSSRTSSSR